MISSLGVGSGLDLGTILDQLRAAEETKLVSIVQEQASFETQLSSYGQVKSAVEGIQSAVEALKADNSFRPVKTNLDSDAISMSADSNAALGTYTLEVLNLATSHALATTNQATKDTAIGDGTLTIELGEVDSGVFTADDDRTLNITLDSSNNTLEGIRDAINAEEGDVTASIVNDGTDTPYRLVISSNTTGTESTIKLSTTGDAALSTLLDYDPVNSGASTLEETVAAEDAQITVNGITINNTTNTFKDSIDGVNFTVSQETDAPVTAKVERDFSSVTKKVEAFVDAYNEVNELIDSLTSYDPDTQIAGALNGDSTVRGIETVLRRALTSVIDDQSTFSTLSDLGVSLELDGTLELDGSVLTDAVENNLADVDAFFNGDEDADIDGFLTVMSSTLDGILSNSGSIKSRTTGIESSIERLEDRFEDTSEDIDETIEIFRRQFQDLDVMIAEMNSTSSYLSQQFASLNAQLSQSNN